MNRDYIWRAMVTDRINGTECAHPPGGDPDRKFSDRELDALHVFKYEILTAFNRLYLSMPPGDADKTIQRFLREMNGIVPPSDE